ncbi:hypothetical protein HY489_06415 [Candidatus Woesearchaeota archaeon]|nr:hypothetical protein [Candidatus Woesearchaeota archaeon]
MIVSDSSPLIFLAKLNVLELVQKLYTKIIIPTEVYEEVITIGKKEGFKEVVVLEQFVSSGFIKQRVVSKRGKDFKNLHEGERSALQLCLQEKIHQMLVDDKEAVECCRIMGIEPIRTTRILLMLLKKKLLNREQFKNGLVKLSNEGYFFTIDVYNYLLEQVNEHTTKDLK